MRHDSLVLAHVRAASGCRMSSSPPSSARGPSIKSPSTLEELSQLSKSVAEQRNERIKRRINRSNDNEKHFFLLHKMNATQRFALAALGLCLLCDLVMCQQQTSNSSDSDADLSGEYGLA